MSPAWRSEALRCAIEIPPGWAPPEERRLPTHAEALVRGDAPGSGLLVQHLQPADAAADLRTWALAPLRLAGLPALALALGPDGWELDEWTAGEDPVDIPGVDEAWGFAGAVRSGESLAGHYALVARRASCAWHVALALNPPDQDAAAATFATLDLH